MKKFIVPLFALVLSATLVFSAVMNISAQETAAEDEIPSNTFVTYGYLETVKEQLKQEILEELRADGGMTSQSLYNDISVQEGQFIYLSPESEVIYRGGGAVAITSSNLAGEGITDMSEGTELFSGEPLEYGHIYYSSETDSKKAILVTGSAAYFTVRGHYEIG